MYFSEHQHIHYWTDTPNEAVGLAINDLAGDLSAVLSATLSPADTPDRANIRLVNLAEQEFDGLDIQPGQWERYQLLVRGEQLIIAGSDRRGLLFGIYQFAQWGLGVDPLGFWIPQRPQRRDRVDVREAETTSSSPALRYRGWFINGEDFLEEWPYGAYREAIDWYGVTHKSISYETYEKLFETMLRLRVNLIIPATVMDAGDPQSAEIFRRIRRRGLLFSTHHIEPVGVCPSHAFTHYCRQRGLDPVFSWSTNREVVEACWKHYIDLLAEYDDSVVWQVGYRGAGDVPFWKTESGAPKSMAGRGEIIAQAIARQIELIEQRLGRSEDIPYTATLWWEGNVLYRNGHVTYPDGVIAVISDVARTQMLPDPLPVCEPDRRYGLYYHTSYWSTGPHLIPGNPPENITANYARALQSGATEYSMHHVSNFRPFLPYIQAVAEMTWQGEAIDPTAYMSRYCQHHYQDRSIAKLYRQYFDCFADRQEPDLQAQNARWLDGAMILMTRHLLMSIENDQALTAENFRTFMLLVGFRLQLLRDNSSPIADEADIDNPENWLCADWAELCDYITTQLLPSLGQWERLFSRVLQVRQQIRTGQNLYDSSLHWQSLIGLTLTRVAHDAFRAARLLVSGDTQGAAIIFEETADDLQRLIRKGPQLAEQDHFKDWTRGDRYANLPGLADQLRNVADLIQQGRMVLAK
jgi:hypothetical protein